MKIIEITLMKIIEITHMKIIEITLMKIIVVTFIFTFCCNIFHRKQDKVGKKPVDTGGGFLIEEDEDGEMEQKIVHPPGSQFEV